MNRFVHLIAIAALGAGLSFTRGAAADNAEEARLLTVLASAAPPAEKDAACNRLKVIGTEACIPALQKLLPDEGLSHPARNALETLPFRGATVALCEGLKATGGSLRLGIIHSLGHRADPAAASALTALLPPDDATTAAVLDALGRIGGPDTPAILLRSLDSTTRKCLFVIRGFGCT